MKTVVFVGHHLYDLITDQRYGCGVLLTRLIENIGTLEHVLHVMDGTEKRTARHPHCDRLDDELPLWRVCQDTLRD